MGTPSVNAQAWPEGITLTWSSARRWTYSVLDDYGLENTLVLPVPSLAAPSALSRVLPALMDGRHGLLPASEERWEHAGLLESWAETAAAYGGDKCDAAYQAAEEEAETFLRWQEELDGEEPGTAAGAGAGLSEDGAEPSALTRYRVLAMRTDEAHPGAATLTNYTEARSVEDALAKVRRANELPGGLYGEQVRAVCETHYAAVTGTNSAQWDTELSRELVGLALQTVHLADREAYPQSLDQHLRANRARLEELWRTYGPEGLYPRGFHHLVELPESFVLCERIDHAPLWLEGVWEQEGHEEISLSRLKKIWLYGTNDKDGR
ncbi:hypothetical protein [Streptomyces sp. NPDC007346]|uniref:hypothetical protein n=1 Tax=Streptomyces sp. NPDC007346 TaxID=3154682 RepID=UPI0034551809